jgi:hypothetical protein
VIVIGVNGTAQIRHLRVSTVFAANFSNRPIFPAILRLLKTMQVDASHDLNRLVTKLFDGSDGFRNRVIANHWIICPRNQQGRFSSIQPASSHARCQPHQ